MTPECAACRFMEIDGAPGGVCRVRPPRMWGEMISPRSGFESRNLDSAVWPRVRFDDWCGAFAAAYERDGETK